MKNPGKLAKTILALLFTMSLLIAQAAASSRTATATVTYRDIKLEVNGQLITPKDAGGNIVEPFIIDGTTYLPVRAVGDALSLDVDWNAETSTVFLDGTDSGEWVNYLSAWPLVLLHSSLDDLETVHREMEQLTGYINVMYDSARDGYLTASNSSAYFEKILDLLGEDGDIIHTLGLLYSEVAGDADLATDAGYIRWHTEARTAVDELYRIVDQIIGMHNALAGFLGGVSGKESEFESLKVTAETALQNTGARIKNAAEATMLVLVHSITG